VTALAAKRRRDLLRLKGQVITIALVLACGMLALIMMRSSYRSLIVARDTYYTEYRFGDVFARVHRAPERIARRLEAISGVAKVYPRLVEDVMVPMPAVPETISGRIISLPDDGEPPLDALYLTAGRMPAPHATDEILVLEQFADIHRLRPGDRLPVVLDGRLRELAITGIAMSPEYVMAMSDRTLFPDKRTFVVMWMPREAVASAYRMEGAFDDVVLALEPHASLQAVLDAVDRELAPYGGLHAVPRAHQPSNYALTGELDNLERLAVIIPVIFLAVAAFLVNVVVSRLVFLERTQIAVLKALGYSNRQVAMHYLGLVAWIVAIGAVLGVVLGLWSAHWMTGMYAAFYRFPVKPHLVSANVILLSIAIALAAATSGALGAALRVARMPPAQAMRPPSPLVYRRSILERLGLRIGPSAMMVEREIERRPFRFLLSVAGIAMGLGMYIFGRFSWDSFDYLMNVAYQREHREDITVTFTKTLPRAVLGDLEHLPGVVHAEGQHIVPVRLRAGSHWRDTVIVGDPVPSALRQLIDRRGRPVALPAEGLVLTDRLARHLGVTGGDFVDAEVLEDRWRVLRLPVAGTIDEVFGLQAHARADWLERVLDQEPRISAALLAVDASDADRVRAKLKQMPAVLGEIRTRQVIANYREQTGRSIVVFTILLGVSAAAIAIGIVYNNARIALSLRSRDLASLRVLGFTRGEVTGMLLAELGVQLIVGIPCGLLFGRWLAHAYAKTIDQDVMRFPVHIASATYAVAAAIALLSGVASALLVRRKLAHLDLMGVLKSE
jgi:putative ABC transport system permease protein